MMIERMKSGRDLPSRNRERISRYATAAKVAAAIPTAILAANADATIYSQTGLNVTVASTQSDVTNFQTFKITGALGAVMGTVAVKRGILRVGTDLRSSWASVEVRNNPGPWNAYMRQVGRVDGTSRLYGALPAGAGATWNAPGRNLNGDFAGTNNNSFSSSNLAKIHFGNRFATSPFNNDPQNVGNTGATWYLLFEFSDGTAVGNYGWLSFTANVGGFGNSSVTFTGWGWDDSGAPIGAGVTASAVPGGAGLAALAVGAAGLRGRRRSRN